MHLSLHSARLPTHLHTADPIDFILPKPEQLLGCSDFFIVLSKAGRVNKESAVLCMKAAATPPRNENYSVSSYSLLKRPEISMLCKLIVDNSHVYRCAFIVEHPVESVQNLCSSSHLHSTHPHRIYISR